MKKLILIVLIILPLNLQAGIFSTEEWMSKYLSPCPKIPGNRVCFDKTKRNFDRMLKYKKMIFRYLDEYGLPRWLAIICVIESECTEKAISKAGAVGLFQIMPFIIQHYLTSTRVVLETEIRTRPTLEKAKKIGMDAEKNTSIAAEHLKMLYEKYGKDEHETVVRAYNAGETRIDRSRKGLGKPLKPETLNYFYQLTALKNILKGYDDYFSE